MIHTEMLVDLGGALSVLARVLVSASTALFLAYVFYVAGMLSTAAAARGIRRFRRRHPRAVAGPRE